MKRERPDPGQPRGNVVYGKRPVNRAAFVIHSAVHEARPDVVAAAHSHSVHGKAFSSLGIPLDPITQDSCVFYEDHVVITAQAASRGVRRRGRRELAAHFPTGKAAIHQNHGLFTVGAVGRRGRLLVPQHGAQLPGAAAGDGRRHAQADPHETGVHPRADRLPAAGWLSFQPLWQEICRTDPDLFD
jgi:hypothetical protein